MRTVAQSIQMLRIMRWIFLGAICFYAIAAEKFGRIAERRPDILYFVIAFISVDLVFLAFFFKQKKIAPALTALKMNETDQTAIRQLQAGYFLAFAMALAICLYGVVLRFLRFPLLLDSPFYLISFTLIAYLVPRLPQ